MSADRSLSLLVNAARVSPLLRDAVQDVKDEINRLRDLLNSAADALAQYYDDDSYAEQRLIQLIEDAVRRQQASPDPVRGPVGSPSGSGSAGEASTSGSMPARGQGCQTCGFDPAATDLSYCTVCRLAAEMEWATSLLFEVVDWLGAPDWGGPQLPLDLARRIAEYCGAFHDGDHEVAP